MGLLRTTYFLSGIFRQAEHNMDRSSARRAHKRAVKAQRSREFWAAREAERRARIQEQQRDARQARIYAAFERIHDESVSAYCPKHLPEDPSQRYWKDDCPVCHPATALSDEDLTAAATLVARGTATQDVAEYVASKTGLDIEAARAALVDALPSMWV